VRDAYRVMFEADNELLTAQNGEIALRVLEQRVVDVVLLDIMMPGLSGLAVLDAMQHLRRPAKVLVISSLDDARSALAALRLEADDYVIKPFDTDELELVVRHRLDEERQRSQARARSGDSSLASDDA
jgi:DNA-binding response OmpR family regulator